MLLVAWYSTRCKPFGHAAVPFGHAVVPFGHAVVHNPTLGCGRDHTKWIYTQAVGVCEGSSTKVRVSVQGYALDVWIRSVTSGHYSR